MNTASAINFPSSSCNPTNAEAVPAHPATTIAKKIAIPLLGMADAAVVITGVGAMLLGLAGRPLIGLELSANYAPWTGMVVVIAVVHTLSWSLRALRCRLAYAPTDHRHRFTAAQALGQLVLGVTGVAIAFWSIDRFVPGAHAVLAQLPQLAAQAVDAVQAWWSAA